MNLRMMRVLTLLFLLQIIPTHPLYSFDYHLDFNNYQHVIATIAAVSGLLGMGFFIRHVTSNTSYKKEKIKAENANKQRQHEKEMKLLEHQHQQQLLKEEQSRKDNEKYVDVLTKLHSLKVKYNWKNKDESSPTAAVIQTLVEKFDESLGMYPHLYFFNQITHDLQFLDHAMHQPLMMKNIENCMSTHKTVHPLYNFLINLRTQIDPTTLQNEKKIFDQEEEKRLKNEYHTKLQQLSIQKEEALTQQEVARAQLEQERQNIAHEQHAQQVETTKSIQKVRDVALNELTLQRIETTKTVHTTAQEIKNRVTEESSKIRQHINNAEITIKNSNKEESKKIIDDADGRWQQQGNRNKQTAEALTRIEQKINTLSPTVPPVPATELPEY